MGLIGWPLDRLGPFGGSGSRRARRQTRPEPPLGRRRPASAADTRPAAPVRDDVLRREHHEPDYSILVAVVALVAIGILMVYSSSALRAYINQDDTLAIVGPQILWAAIGLVVMAIVMRIDYRILRLFSVPGYIAAIGLLVLVFVPSLNRVVGGSARWLVIGPLPAVHPAEVAKLALIVYLAHWLANRGTKIVDFRTGTIPFLLITAPIVLLVLREPDLGTTIVIAATAFTMFFVAGAGLWQFLGIAAMGAVGGALFFLRGYQLDRIRAWLDPWADPLGSGFHTIQGLLALGLGGLLGSGLGESKLAGGLYLPNAWNDFIFAIIGEEFGFIGAAVVIALFGILAIAGIRTALRAPDTFGALLAAGITAWLCLQAFVNIGVVVALLPVTGITLPFISAGGSSLVVSFAAVGILLSISRETLEAAPRPAKEFQPSQGVAYAPADRGRGNGRSHLPGPRRRVVAPAPRGRG
ncbi:MAG TPA: putative lipid II flippase FtsW [Candidatus Limnocylindrales bacterium]|nr:putative lipid II flippase FtsW [Candidatus Limnocylindrales bacterium]